MKRDVESLVKLLDIKVHYFLGALSIILIFALIFLAHRNFFGLPKFLFSLLVIVLIIVVALLSFAISTAGASYIKKRDENVIEIRSRNILLSFLVLLIYGITIFLYYITVSEIIKGNTGWESIMSPILLTILSIFLAPAIFEDTIRIDNEYLYYKTFHKEKKIKLTGIFHVSPSLGEVNVFNPLSIYSRDGIIHLEGIFNSPVAIELIQRLLLQKLGETIFNPNFDFRKLDKETKQLIEKEKVIEGTKVLRATAWSNEAAVLVPGIFFFVFFYMALVSAVYYFLEGNSSRFIVCLIFTIALGSFSFWILIVIIKLWHFEFKIFKSSSETEPQLVLQQILDKEELSYKTKPKNKIPLPHRFEHIWEINDDFFLRFKKVSGNGEMNYWVSIGPIKKGNESIIARIKEEIDNTFQSIT